MRHAVSPLSNSAARVAWPGSGVGAHKYRSLTSPAPFSRQVLVRMGERRPGVLQDDLAHLPMHDAAFAQRCGGPGHPAVFADGD